MKTLLRIEDPFECSILERVNRFVVKVRSEGELLRAYINNTGRLHNYLAKGRHGFCMRHQKPKKTDCRLFAIADKESAAVLDTWLQMKVFERALEKGVIPWARNCHMTKRNVSLGKSLIDYLLECEEGRTFLEVKSAVLRENEHAAYPDCPSARGRKHIAELTDHVKRGGQGALLFIAALPKVKGFRPHKSSDLEMFRLLREAADSGVVMKCIGLYYDPKCSSICLYDPDLKVDLS